MRYTVFMTEKFTDISIETLILVAVWQKPAVFQGCFRISDKHSARKRYFFFRCENPVCDERSLLEEAFSPLDYRWTSLFEETTKVYWDTEEDTKSNASYVLKYALHTTLLEMLRSQKYNFLSIDAVAMQSLVSQVKPMLESSEISWSKDYPDLGFAVVMDFLPHEETAEQAAVVLLGKRSSIH